MIDGVFGSCGLDLFVVRSFAKDVHIGDLFIDTDTIFVDGTSELGEDRLDIECWELDLRVSHLRLIDV